MRKTAIILGLLSLYAQPARSDMIYDHTPTFRPFREFELLMVQILNNAIPTQVDKVLTVDNTGPDMNKDGFVTDRISNSADPLGYEALHSDSLWGNVRVILSLPRHNLPDNRLPFVSADTGGPVEAPSVGPAPEPATLALLLGGAAFAAHRKKSKQRG